MWRMGARRTEHAPPDEARRFTLAGVDVFVFVHGRDPAVEALALTPQEQQLVALIEAGLSNKAIGARVEASEASVRRRLERLYRRLGVGSRAELALLLQSRRGAES